MSVCLFFAKEYITLSILLLEIPHSYLMKLSGNNTRFGPVLDSVITYTEELAQKQAEKADELLGKGVYLGR